MVKFHKLIESDSIEMELLSMGDEDSENAPLITLASEENLNEGMEIEESIQAVNTNSAEKEKLPAPQETTKQIKKSICSPQTKEVCSELHDMFLFIFIVVMVLLIIVLYILSTSK